VHTGARVAALAAPGELPASRTIRDLVAGSPIRLERRGTHELKGVPGPWEIFAVTGCQPDGGGTQVTADPAIRSKAQAVAFQNAELIVT